MKTGKLYDQGMNRRIPRGQGYNKVAILRHLKQMVKGGTFVTQYCRDNGLKVDSFILAVERYDDAGAWSYELIRDDPKFIQETCTQCKEEYWPSRKGTKFCSSYCSNMFRTDREYFGGNRNSTVGLQDSVCQLCQRHVEKGLSSHHIYGKANDVDNEYLLALCKGCHSIVSDLALKNWAGNSRCLEKLLWLAYTQRNGKDLIALRKEEGMGITVTVSFSLTPYGRS